MYNPFFTIITCTKNSAKYIVQNIDSVSGQTYISYEHVFVDGFSTDDTLSLINSYRKANPKTVRLSKRKPKGISDAMNEGIRKARGKYLIFLHSDDSLYTKSVLQDAYGFLKKEKFPDWIVGKIRVIDEGKGPIGFFPSRFIYKLLPRYFLKFYNLIPHQAVIMKKTVFKRFGLFDEKLTSSMDLDLWLKIWNKTRWKKWNEVVSNYLISKTGQSSGIKNLVENENNIVRVKRRYLNNFEMLVSNKILDRYNKALR